MGVLALLVQMVEFDQELDSMNDLAFEEHFSLADLTQKWGFGRETLRKIFKDEPGVVAIRLGKKKMNTRYQIPASVAARVHRRLMNQ